MQTIKLVNRYQNHMQNFCRNGLECYYYKRGECRYFHPQGPVYTPKKGAFECPSKHFSTKLQLTGKPCSICKRSVQGYGLECTVCQYYVCRKCQPICHSLICEGPLPVPINKMKTCRRCNKLITNNVYYCPRKCNFFVCHQCLDDEIRERMPKKKYVEKKSSEVKKLEEQMEVMYIADQKADKNS